MGTRHLTPSPSPGTLARPDEAPDAARRTPHLPLQSEFAIELLQLPLQLPRQLFILFPLPVNLTALVTAKHAALKAPH